jgi:hypothetical protein
MFLESAFTKFVSIFCTKKDLNTSGLVVRHLEFRCRAMFAHSRSMSRLGHHRKHMLSRLNFWPSYIEADIHLGRFEVETGSEECKMAAV